METSLAPSPMARVTLLGNLTHIIFTMSDFCLGDTRHAKTTSTNSQMYMNIF